MPDTSEQLMVGYRAAVEAMDKIRAEVQAHEQTLAQLKERWQQLAEWQKTISAQYINGMRTGPSFAAEFERTSREMTTNEAEQKRRNDEVQKLTKQFWSHAHGMRSVIRRMQAYEERRRKQPIPTPPTTVQSEIAKIAQAHLPRTVFVPTPPPVPPLMEKK